MIFLEFGGEEKAAGTRGAFAECPGGSSGVIRGAVGLHPGGLRLGTSVALGDHQGKFHSTLGFAAHSGLPGGVH